MVKVDYKTGSVIKSENKNTIYEAFLKGYRNSSKKEPETKKIIEGIRRRLILIQLL